MTINEATTDDIESIRRVVEASWNADYPEILSREAAQEGVEEWYAPERLETEIESDDAFVPVAEHEGEVVGFAHAVLDESGATILRLYVAPDHRRQGIGRDLLEHTHAALSAKDAERVRAMVLAENEPGNAFYQRFGFELDEESETVIGEETYRENVYIAET